MKFYYIACSSPTNFCFASAIVKASSKEDAITKMLNNYEIELKNIQKDHRLRNPNCTTYWTDEYVLNSFMERKDFIEKHMVEIDETTDICRYDEQWV